VGIGRREEGKKTLKSRVTRRREDDSSVKRWVAVDDERTDEMGDQV